MHDEWVPMALKDLRERVCVCVGVCMCESSSHGSRSGFVHKHDGAVRAAQ